MTLLKALLFFYVAGLVTYAFFDGIGERIIVAILFGTIVVLWGLLPNKSETLDSYNNN